jgi:hypothetical protein
LHDEVAYVLTTATLLKEVQAAVQADKDNDGNRRHLNDTRTLSDNAKIATAPQQLSTYLAAANQTE